MRGIVSFPICTLTLASQIAPLGPTTETWTDERASNVHRCDSVEIHPLPSAASGKASHKRIPSRRMKSSDAVSYADRVPSGGTIRRATVVRRRSVVRLGRYEVKPQNRIGIDRAGFVSTRHARLACDARGRPVGVGKIVVGLAPADAALGRLQGDDIARVQPAAVERDVPR